VIVDVRLIDENDDHALHILPGDRGVTLAVGGVYITWMGDTGKSRALATLRRLLREADGLR
jgi:hypothetical protein